MEGGGGGNDFLPCTEQTVRLMKNNERYALQLGGGKERRKKEWKPEGKRRKKGRKEGYKKERRKKGRKENKQSNDTRIYFQSCRNCYKARRYF